MEMYNKVIFNEKNNTITEKGYDNDFSNVQNLTKNFNNSYSAEKVRRAIDEFDNISISDTDFNTRTITQSNVITKSKVSFRTKLYLTSSIIIAAMLVFLAIYNLFVINSLNNSINILEETATNQAQKLNTEYYAMFGEELSEENIKNELQSMGFSDNSENTITLKLAEVQTVSELQGETNWFDAVCNFISGVFGG